MAEFSFQEVARHWKRMCNKYWRSTTCHGCPIAEHEHCYEACSDIDIDISMMEEVVMSWAEENPEPVYPTWGEWLADVGVLVCDTSFPNKRYWYTINKLKLEQPIPADIAEKLGLEAKEG